MRKLIIPFSILLLILAVVFIFKLVSGSFAVLNSALNTVLAIVVLIVLLLLILFMFLYANKNRK